MLTFVLSASSVSAQNDPTKDDWKNISPSWSYNHIISDPYFNGFVGITTLTPERNMHITGLIPMPGPNGEIGTFPFQSSDFGIRLDCAQTQWQGGVFETESERHLNLESAVVTNSWELLTNEYEFHIDRLSNGTNKEHLTILNNGNVGIGSTSPSGGLTIDYSDNAKAIILERNGSSASQNVQMSLGIGSNQGIPGARFRMSDDDGANWDEALFLAKDSRVAIGTAVTRGALTIDGGQYGTGGNGLVLERNNAGYVDVLMNVAISSNGGSAGARFQMSNDDGTSYTDALFLAKDGRVAIGTTKPATGYQLSVEGAIIAEELVVDLQPWPDYVFEEQYSLLSLKELHHFIQKNGHLPNVPKANSIEEKGLSVGEMQATMMEKIEELTLYILQLEQRITELEPEKNSE